ncbi:MAG: ABC transporter ATP-binding protein [Clostridiales bacterium]|jgi:ABC-2 type transport system ATP-binding protein|nr:ABC transporter ATP-binding protein [Clostridiales bacterium]
MLKITNLSKAYAKSNIYAVRNLTLELKKGEIFGFLGPNGAGKTTTIKAITGILPYELGEIQICGFDLKTEPLKAKQNFGYVSDNHIIYDKLTGREYVNFMADIYKVSLADRKERSQRMLEVFKLTDSYDAQIRTYSHGMKQKIHIIGAMIHKPPLWILDEPMTGLDPQSNFELKELMRGHCNDGNNVFFSTHILEVAERICDRIGIIVKGQLVSVGTMEQLKNSKDMSLEQIFLELAKN